MLKNNNNQLIMHGENVLMPTNLPVGAVKATDDNLFEGNNIIIGHSESGHNHVLESKSKNDLELYEKDGAVYVRVNKPSLLVHRKSFDIHQPIEVAVGIYRINHKTEYDPFKGITRAVYD